VVLARMLALDAGLSDLLLARAQTPRLLNRPHDSIAAFRQALDRGEDAELIKYHLAALGAEPPPTEPPEQNIVGVFDSYADTFDRDLVSNLKYRTPISLAGAEAVCVLEFSRHLGPLGCGTGLVGEQLLALKRTLTGVDLSPNMSAKAPPAWHLRPIDRLRADQILGNTTPCVQPGGCGRCVHLSRRFIPGISGRSKCPEGWRLLLFFG
jgi:predicted TPR repeat methyltransferase